VSRWTILDLAAFLHCEALAMFAYFDETGIHDSSKVAAIAGYVGTKDEWFRVETAWQAVLAPYAQYGLTWWHQADYLSRQGQYTGIRQTEIYDAMFNRLVAIIKDSQLQVIWAGVDAEAFKVTTTPEWRERYAPKPYDFCYYWIIRQLTSWSFRTGYTDNIGLTFAVQDEFNGRSELALRSWQSFGLLEQFRPFSVDYPKFRPALQPADILANELYHLLQRYKRGGHAAPGQVLQDLSQSGRLQEGGLATEETIRRLMDNPDWANPGLQRISE
jgi:hypothetical protein